MKTILLLAFLATISLTACDSNVDREDRTAETRADSVSAVMEKHVEEMDELTGSIEEKLEALNNKLNTDENAGS